MFVTSRFERRGIWRLKKLFMVNTVHRGLDVTAVVVVVAKASLTTTATERSSSCWRLKGIGGVGFVSCCDVWMRIDGRVHLGWP